MHSTLILSTLVGLAIAAPRPQLMNLDAIDAAPDPVFMTPSYDVVSETPAVSKRGTLVQKRDGTCAQQPDGYGPVASPDTVDAFIAFPTLQACSQLWIELQTLTVYRQWRQMLPHQMAMPRSSLTRMPL